METFMSASLASMSSLVNRMLAGLISRWKMFIACSDLIPKRSWIAIFQTSFSPIDCLLFFMRVILPHKSPPSAYSVTRQKDLSFSSQKASLQATTQGHLTLAKILISLRELLSSLVPILSTLIFLKAQKLLSSCLRTLKTEAKDPSPNLLTNSNFSVIAMNNQTVIIHFIIIQISTFPSTFHFLFLCQMSACEKIFREVNLLIRSLLTDIQIVYRQYDAHIEIHKEYHLKVLMSMFAPIKLSTQKDSAKNTHITYFHNDNDQSSGQSSKEEELRDHNNMVSQSGSLTFKGIARKKEPTDLRMQRVLKQWILEQIEGGLPITKNKIQKQAILFSKSKTFRGSGGWLRGFFRRNPRMLELLQNYNSLNGDENGSASEAMKQIQQKCVKEKEKIEKESKLDQMKPKQQVQQAESSLCNSSSMFFKYLRNEELEDSDESILSDDFISGGDLMVMLKERYPDLSEQEIKDGIIVELDPNKTGKISLSSYEKYMEAEHRKSRPSKQVRN